MNLLIFSPWFPCPPDNGSRIRAFHLIEKLGRAGYAIRLITGMQDDIAPNADFAALESICESVQVFPWKWHDGRTPSALLKKASTLVSPVPRSISETDNPPLRAAITAEFARRPDVCVAMQLAAAPFIPMETHGVPVLLEEVEVSGVTRNVAAAPSTAAKWQATLTKQKHDRYWRRELRRFSALTVVSDDEAVAVRELLGTDHPSVDIAPNGVDVGYYQGWDHSPVPGRILYNGALTYGLNRDAVAWFVRDILPLIVARVPDAHLVVTGRYDADSARDYEGESRVRLTGFLADLRPTLAEATLCAVPLLGGGGTRLKILEAWAAEIPVVSTSVGAAGLAGSQDGIHLLRADTAVSFAEACVRVLTEPETATRLAGNARSLVHARYDWSAIVAQMASLLDSLRTT